MVDLAATVFRDFETDGVPASGAHKPKKAKIREWGTYVEAAALGATAGAAVFASRATLDATLTYAANTMAWVIGDATAANNGIYRKSGASGSGSWARLADLPYSFIQAANVGSGTANAIVATASTPLPSSAYRALIVMNVFEANTGAVTVSINGATAKPLVTNSGAPLVAGNLNAGMLAIFVDDGASYRLLSDVASLAIVAAAEAAAAVAADYANLARNNWVVNGPFVGTGSEADYLLTVDPGSANNMLVVVGGVAQIVTLDAYSLVHSEGSPYIRINAPAGVPFEVRTSNAITVGTPSEGSVGRDKLDPSVTALLDAAAPGHLFGLTLSNNAADATNDIDIAAGSAASSDTVPVLMTLAAGLTKRLDAAWAVGNNQGGLDTGSIANTTYHVWQIRRPDTGVVDVLFSASATAPTMPANYTQKRRIGSILRAGGMILAFKQNGDHFDHATQIQDRSSTAAQASTLLALSVPTGIVVQPKVFISQIQGTVGNCQTRLASAGGLMLGYTTTIAAGEVAVVNVNGGIFSNTSAQIQFEATINSGTFSGNVLVTKGWIDTRGRIG